MVISNIRNYWHLHYRSKIRKKQEKNKGMTIIMIRFDKLFKTLKKNGISQYYLYTYCGVSRAQIQRLKEGCSVTTHTLDMILNILGEGFTLNDIAEFIPDNNNRE